MYNYYIMLLKQDDVWTRTRGKFPYLDPLKSYLITPDLVDALLN